MSQTARSRTKGLAQLALALASVLCTTSIAAGQDVRPYSRTETPPVSAGKIVAFDVRRQADGEIWSLVIAPGGAHIGWVRAKDAHTGILPCLSVPLDSLYGSTKP